MSLSYRISQKIKLFAISSRFATYYKWILQIYISQDTCSDATQLM